MLDFLDAAVWHSLFEATSHTLQQGTTQRAVEVVYFGDYPRLVDTTLGAQPPTRLTTLRATCPYYAKHVHVERYTFGPSVRG
jgi:hypothetical protein